MTFGKKDLETGKYPVTYYTQFNMSGVSSKLNPSAGFNYYNFNLNTTNFRDFNTNNMPKYLDRFVAKFNKKFKL